MRWSDVVAPPSQKTLRQFSFLLLVLALWMMGWAWWHQAYGVRFDIGVVAGVIALVGIARPNAVRWLFTGWMIVAFPIGWTVSHIMLGALFYGLFTPVALVFRMIGRDALRLRRDSAAATYWREKKVSGDVRDYLRQF